MWESACNYFSFSWNLVSLLIDYDWISFVQAVPMPERKTAKLNGQCVSLF